MDHLGVIATMYDDIGISDIIDEFTGIHHNQTVSCGQATKAMVLNMLAIFMRPLYLVSKYLHGKPVHRLIAENLQAKDFTDDVLGRTLDKLYEHDLEAIFLKITSVAFNKYSDFQSPYLHGDTSLMKVHGEYGTNNFDNAIEITYACRMASFSLIMSTYSLHEYVRHCLIRANATIIQLSHNLFAP